MKSFSLFLSNNLSNDFLVNWGVLLALCLDWWFELCYEFWVCTLPNSICLLFWAHLRDGDGLFSNFSKIFLRFSLFLEGLFVRFRDEVSLETLIYVLLKVFFIFFKWTVLDLILWRSSFNTLNSIWEKLE